ncbi:lmo0937 family membrane protein [Flavobacterium rhizosphaerae]|uniref:Lmo0937 family membrane protein n=1 Tax=Flavobacterium rhizosphaerae TaxID=3163298 RepID=A0ABW8YTW5_9FLAO
MKGLLYTIAVIMVIVWVLGLVFKIAGAFIHLLLVVAVIMVVYNLIKGSNKV